MIQEKIEKRKSISYRSMSTEKEITVYECSDGKKFTNENDHNPRFEKGKRLAELHEERLSIVALAKEELKYRSIVDDRYNNEGYEKSFLFYYHNNLSSSARSCLYSLIHSVELTEINDFTEGWYFVDQSVYEVESCGMNAKYRSDGYCKPLSRIISEKEKDLLYYKNLNAELLHDEKQHYTSGGDSMPFL